MLKFICPSCKDEDFSASESSYTCGSCGKTYEKINGIPAFKNSNARFAWGNIQQNKMDEMINACGPLSWHDAMFNMLSELPLKKALLVWNRTFGSRRMAMSLLLPLHPDASVLDFGSGWGTVVMNIAPHCKDVVSVDQMFHHLEWQKTASDARGIKNITFAQCADTSFLPFPSNSFDIVILNGVMEWLASNTRGKPRQVQLQFLKEFQRILKPEGILYIGIENRLNYKYFKGAREGHIRMKYGALLPRFITDAYLRLARGKPYREYTYSLFGYKKLLKAAGFGHANFYVPLPHYGTIFKLFPVERESNGRDEPWKVKASDRFAHKPLSYFAPSYVMTAAKESQPRDLLTRIITKTKNQLKWDRPVILDENVFRVTSSGKAFSKIIIGSGSSVLLRVGLVVESGKRIQNHHEALKNIVESNIESRLRELVPQPLFLGWEDMFVYSVEPLYEGRPGSEVTKNKAGIDLLCGDAHKILVELARQKGTTTTIDEDTYAQYFTRPLSSIRKWFTSKEWSAYTKWVDDVSSSMKQKVLNREILLPPRHGDFVPGNCLVNQNGKICKILDWELYEEHGLPLYDLITFLGRAYRPKVKESMVSRGEDPDRVKFHGYPFIFLEGELNEYVLGYLKELGMSEDLFVPLLFMWWVKQLEDWEDLLLYHPEWRRLRVFPIIERLKTLFAEI